MEQFNVFVAFIMAVLAVLMLCVLVFIFFDIQEKKKLIRKLELEAKSKEKPDSK